MEDIHRCLLWSEIIKYFLCLDKGTSNEILSKTHSSAIFINSKWLQTINRLTNMYGFVTCEILKVRYLLHEQMGTCLQCPEIHTFTPCLGAKIYGHFWSKD